MRNEREERKKKVLNTILIDKSMRQVTRNKHERKNNIWKYLKLKNNLSLRK